MRKYISKRKLLKEREDILDVLLWMVKKDQKQNSLINHLRKTIANQSESKNRLLRLCCKECIETFVETN